MDVSIIIPTYNRPSSVRRLVSSLAREVNEHHLGDRVEIIVVDDGSPAEASRAIQGFLPDVIGVQIHYVPRPRRSGPGAARNSGVDRSRGRLLAFVDDDVLPAQDYIRDVMSLHHAHPESLVITGNLRPLRDDIYSRFWFYHYDAVFNRQAEMSPVPMLASGNLAIKRELLDIERPLFDESLPTREDYDLYLRLRQEGIPVHKTQGMLAFNDCRTSFPAFIRQRIGYASGQERLAAKHGAALLARNQAARVPRAPRFLHLHLAVAIAVAASRLWRRLGAAFPREVRQ